MRMRHDPVRSAKLKELAISADIFNAINGGMSAPVIQMKENEDYYLLSVKVPGVKSSSLKTEIQNGQLFVFHILPLPGNPSIITPYFVKVLKIPEDAITDEMVVEEIDQGVRLVIPKEQS